MEWQLSILYWLLLNLTSFYQIYFIYLRFLLLRLYNNLNLNYSSIYVHLNTIIKLVLNMEIAIYDHNIRPFL